MGRLGLEGGGTPSPPGSCPSHSEPTSRPWGLSGTYTELGLGQPCLVAAVGPWVQWLCEVTQQLTQHLGHVVHLQGLGSRVLGQHLSQLAVEQAQGLEVIVEVQERVLGDKVLQLHPLLQEQPHKLGLVGDERGQHHGVQI